MAEWYGVRSLSVKAMKPFMSILFGNECKQLPSFYVPENLDCLIENINLPRSQYFSIYNDVIEKMTVFPFYSRFIASDTKLTLYESFRNKSLAKQIEHKFNIRRSEYYHENALNIKFCLSCIKEKNSFYLNREHQIQNNVICYKHNERLKYIEYNYYAGKTWNAVWKTKLYNSQFYISEDDPFLKIRIEVAYAIHKVFQNNLIDSNIVIKSKLRKKLKLLGYMDKNHNYFFDIEKFWNDFSSYNFLHINGKQLFRTLFSTSREVNPVAYITLILFLFGTLEEFIKFNIDDEEIIDINYFKNSYSLLMKPKHGTRVLDDYNLILREKHGDVYEAVTIEDNGYIRVKHKKCGHSWPVFINYLRDFKECPSCKKERRYLECKNLIEENDSEYEFINLDSNNRKNILIYHKKCGRELSMPIDSIKMGKKCFNCSITDKFKQKVYDLVGDEYLVLKYGGLQKKASILHNISSCMQTIEHFPNNFIMLRQCPVCGKKKNYIDSRYKNEMH